MAQSPAGRTGRRRNPTPSPREGSLHVGVRRADPYCLARPGRLHAIAGLASVVEAADGEAVVCGRRFFDRGYAMPLDRPGVAP